MKDSVYGASCCFCRRPSDTYKHAWPETMMANQKYFMDLFLRCKDAFDKYYRLNIDLLSEALNDSDSGSEGKEDILTQEMKDILDQVRKDIDCEPEVFEDLVKTLKNPSVDNFYEFFLNRERSIPTALWSAGPYEALRKSYTPPLTQRETQNYMEAMRFAQIYHDSLNQGVIVSPEEIDQRLMAQRHQRLRAQNQIMDLLVNSRLDNNTSQNFELQPGMNFLDVIAPDRHLSN